MREPNYTQIRPPGRLFDNVAFRLILHLMQPLRLKAFRSCTAIAALLIVSMGCQSDGQPVSGETSALPATPQIEPILLAQTDPPAAVSSEKPVVLADVPSVNATPLSTEEATAKAIAEVGGTNAPSNEATSPAITKEIPPARPANLKISDSTEKIIKLTESNLDEKVILTFVQQTPSKFDLDADEIVYLSDLGVPSPVIAAMLKHDGDDPSKAAALTAAPNTENVQPAIPANTNAANLIAQTQPPPPGTISQVPPQGVEVTTNYVPNPYLAQQPVYQQPPQVVVQQPVVEEAPPVVYAAPETVSYFYDSLSPYGSWFYVSDYGWCWQPTVAVADHGWRPYGPRGHWVWTDDGWYWASDYSWGWAPFHYGRWFMHGGRGWIWCPDHVWGPSWVAWRSSGDYCGWAPLPPHAVFTPGIGFTYFGRGVDVSFGFGLGFDAFCFAPVGRFHNHRVYDYCLPRRETLGVFAHSRVENRWEFRNGRRDFVNRAGPRLETGARPAVVRTMSERDQNRFGSREHVERTGRDTVIYRPPAPPAPAAIAGRGSVGAAQRAANEAFNPRTRGSVNTGASTASGIASPAGQPQVRDSRASRGSADEAARSPVTSRPSPLAGREAPTALTPSQTVNPATRSRESSRAITSVPSTPETTQTPASTAPAPTPRRGFTPAEPNSRSSRVADSSTVPAPTTRPAPIVNETQTAPMARRPLADAAPVTRALPGSPAYNDALRANSSAESAASQRPIARQEAPRVLTPSTTVAPPPRTVAPSPQIYSPPPRTVAPPPVTSTAPSYSAPAYTPPMRGNTPSPAPAPTYQAPVSRAPAYQAPVSRAPVTQAPVTRGAEPRQATSPNTSQPGRSRRD
jgi:hypothetical protein